MSWVSEESRIEEININSENFWEIERITEFQHIMHYTLLEHSARNSIYVQV